MHKIIITEGERDNASLKWEQSPYFDEYYSIVDNNGYSILSIDGANAHGSYHGSSIPIFKQFDNLISSEPTKVIADIENSLDKLDRLGRLVDLLELGTRKQRPSSSNYPVAERIRLLWVDNDSNLFRLTLAYDGGWCVKAEKWIAEFHDFKQFNLDGSSLRALAMQIYQYFAGDLE